MVSGLTSGRHIGICPEGTCAAIGSLMRFRTSAFTLGCPIVPATIKYHCLLDMNWTTHHWLVAIANLLVNPCGLVTITFHEPMEKQEGEDYQQFADRVGKHMADYLGYTYTNYQSQDWVYFRHGLGTPTQQYAEDFGWMGKLDDFCKKHHLKYWSGLKTWQVKNILPPKQE